MMRPSGTVSPVPELDRSHPAVTTLAALADVDPRTALAWLQGLRVKRRNARRLEEALPRAVEAVPMHTSAYAGKVPS